MASSITLVFCALVSIAILTRLLSLARKSKRTAEVEASHAGPRREGGLVLWSASKMKLRFTIRDLLWLTLVVALGLGWRADHRHPQELLKKCETLQEQVSIERNNVLKSQAEVESLRGRLTTIQQEKWFGELPLILSGEPHVLLLRACAYVAWEAKIVIERRAWYRLHPVRVEIDVSDVQYFDKFSLGDPSLQISWLRLWMNDGPRTRVFISSSASISDKRVAAALFPEADILEIPRGYPK